MPGRVSALPDPTQTPCHAVTIDSGCTSYQRPVFVSRVTVPGVKYHKVGFTGLMDPPSHRYGFARIDFEVFPFESHDLVRRIYTVVRAVASPTG